MGEYKKDTLKVTDLQIRIWFCHFLQKQSNMININLFQYFLYYYYYVYYSGTFLKHIPLLKQRIWTPSKVPLIHLFFLNIETFAPTPIRSTRPASKAPLSAFPPTLSPTSEFYAPPWPKNISILRFLTNAPLFTIQVYTHIYGMHANKHVHRTHLSRSDWLKRQVFHSFTVQVREGKRQ